MLSTIFLVFAVGGFISLIFSTLQASFQSAISKWCVAGILAISAINTIILIIQGAGSWLY